MNDHEAFLRTIADQPGDDGPKLIYADWLDEHGDPRGELIRNVVELNRIRQRMLVLPNRINELSRHADPDWLVKIFGRFRVVLLNYPPDRKIPTIIQIRRTIACGLKEAKDLSESLPATIVDGVQWDVAQRVFGQFTDATVSIEPSTRFDPYPPGAPVIMTNYRIILRSHLTGAKLQTIKALRSLTFLGAAAARELVESLPRVLRERATYQDVERFRAAFRPFAEIDAVPLEPF